ncbi:uncharacterized protein J4E84_009512 [Alternaria hordeiaustralica]|uniref:uncharacterized protein n=1 Tax=Alternaria hordeiaustralica TaxID=1187925 RepID=UPI0020C28156|nr:uncharacterized protein J4E84_009512 [Alternaria hordeiaustralica]KAI4676677.1 hypothetical protein J4E84_009512 [Alternaria hordeiaustralica]
MPSPLDDQSTSKEKRDESAHDGAATRDLREQARREEITEANATSSPLLRLPAELRNTIYTYVFGDNKWIFADWDRMRGSNSFKKSNLGLLLTSRQLHEETALLPYMLGRFVFRNTFGGIEMGDDRVDEFLEGRSEEQLAAIGRLAAMRFDKKRGRYAYTSGTGVYWAKTLGLTRE